MEVKRTYNVKMEADKNLVLHELWNFVRFVIVRKIR